MDIKRTSPIKQLLAEGMTIFEICDLIGAYCKHNYHVDDCADLAYGNWEVHQLEKHTISSASSMIAALIEQE